MQIRIENTHIWRLLYSGAHPFSSSGLGSAWMQGARLVMILSISLVIPLASFITRTRVLRASYMDCVTSQTQLLSVLNMSPEAGPKQGQRKRAGGALNTL